jgi:hypothetical protein
MGLKSLKNRVNFFLIDLCAMRAGLTAGNNGHDCRERHRYADVLEGVRSVGAVKWCQFTAGNACGGTADVPQNRWRKLTKLKFQFRVKAFPEPEPVWSLPFSWRGVLAGQICRCRWRGPGWSL